MVAILRYLETVDIGGLFVLVLAFLFVGNKLSQGYGRVRGFCFGLSGLLFVSYVGLHFVQNSVYRDDLASLAFRGILGAGLVLGASWIVLTAVAACYEKISGTLSRWSDGLARMFENRRRNRLEKADRQRRDEQYAASALERERLQKKTEEQAKASAEAQKRREDARARCEVLFATHSFEIRERFTREMFDAFVSRHLGEDKPPEYVEKLAVELCGIIQKHLEKASGGAQKTLAELAEWFLKEKKQIESTALSDRDKQDMLSQLEERYVKLQGKYLRSMQP